MKLIVGLGNPGKQYERTRHNAGFRVLDLLGTRIDAEFGRQKFKGLYGQGVLPTGCSGPVAGDGKLLLVKPQTYMNLSGETVVSFAGFYKIGIADLLIVVDDVALPLGLLRLRRSGSAGGHNGLKDVQARLGSQAYARLRLGVGGREAGDVGRPDDLAGHVLGRFSAPEEKLLDAALKRAADACLTWAGFGIEQAMNVYNVQGDT